MLPPRMGRRPVIAQILDMTECGKPRRKDPPTPSINLKVSKKTRAFSTRVLKNAFLGWRDTHCAQRPYARVINFVLNPQTELPDCELVSENSSPCHPLNTLGKELSEFWGVPSVVIVSGN